MDNEKPYIKTYKPFIMWLINFPIVSVVISNWLSVGSVKIAVIINLMLLMIALYVLMLIIYKGEYVYWINGGPSFEQAKASSSEKRKAYAKAHLDIFKNAMWVSFGYAAISIILSLPMLLDTIATVLIIVVSAFRTMFIKFEK